MHSARAAHCQPSASTTYRRRLYKQADLGGGTSAVLLSLADLTIAPLLRWPDGRCPDAVRSP